MKIKQEHLKHLKEKISIVLEKNPDAVQRYESGNFNKSELVKDLQKRFCFDLLHCAGLLRFICDELYQYMNDEHIYTALKRVCPKIERKY